MIFWFSFSFLPGQKGRKTAREAELQPKPIDVLRVTRRHRCLLDAELSCGQPARCNCNCNCSCHCNCCRWTTHSATRCANFPLSWPTLYALQSPICTTLHSPLSWPTTNGFLKQRQSDLCEKVWPKVWVFEYLSIETGRDETRRDETQSHDAIMLSKCFMVLAYAIELVECW